MRHTLLLAAFSLLGGLLPPVGAADPTYWQDVRPLLRRHCTTCHNDRHSKDRDVSGGLSLESYESLTRPAGKPLLQARHGDESLLVRIVATPDADRRMPLGRKPLPASAIDLLRRWIDAGAPEGTPSEVSTETPAKRRPRRLELVVSTSLTPPRNLFPEVEPAPLELVFPATGPLSPLTAVRFSSDGRLLATGSHRLITVWDTGHAHPVRMFVNVPGLVHDLRFSPDNRLLAVAGGQPGVLGDVRLFRLDTGDLAGVLKGHEDVVTSIAFRPDGRLLASASHDRTVRVWDVSRLSAVHTFRGHADVVTALAYSPDGRRLASASRDRTVRVVEPETGKSCFTLNAGDRAVLAVAYSPDGNYLLSSGEDPALVWWASETGKKVQGRAGHRDFVGELTFSRDGRWIYSAGAEGLVRKWDHQGFKEVMAYSTGSMVHAVDVSPDGRTVATGSFDGRARLFDTERGHLRVLLITVAPRDREVPGWLALAGGYVIGWPTLLDGSQWRMGRTVVPRDPVWRALFRPQAVSQIMQGRPQGPPSFDR